MPSVNPTAEQLTAVAALAADPTDGPVVMLNLNRYRERAVYEQAPPGGEDADVSGREAYGRYGAVALATLLRVGGQIVWHAQATLTVIGEDVWDEIIAVQYPSTQAFLDLVTDETLTVALAHRDAGLERACIVRSVSDHFAPPT